MTEFDQRHQKVNRQYNVSINEPLRKDASSLITKGIKLIEAKAYKRAISLLREAAETDSSLPEAYYYWALALMQGMRPRVLQRKQIEEIDQLLQTACALGDDGGAVQWFRVLLRSDYYGWHKMACPSPSIPEIIGSVGSTDVRRLRALLQKLPMKDDHYYRELVKQAF